MALNGAAIAAMHDAVWLDANRYYEAERVVLDVKRPNPGHHISESSAGLTHSSIAREIAFARQKIQNFLKSAEAGTTDTNSTSIVSRLESVEKEIATYRKELTVLYSSLEDVTGKMARFEEVMKKFTNCLPDTPPRTISKAPDSKSGVQNGSSATADGDDDLDLFGSDDEEDEAVEKLKEERLKAYANKKAKKPALVAKSSVVLDVKPWDDETDMKEMEKAVRAIKTDGLLWGASKLVPLAYGISKLQIIAIVEDEKVSIDWLQETICEIEDLVQSVDIAAFNKL